MPRTTGTSRCGTSANLYVLFGSAEIDKALFPLGGINVNTECKLNIVDVISAQVGVHDARDRRVVRGVFVELDFLYERGGTVAYADDGDTYFFCAIA
jgi:hypothetical protein